MEDIKDKKTSKRKTNTKSTSSKKKTTSATKKVTKKKTTKITPKKTKTKSTTTKKKNTNRTTKPKTTVNKKAITSKKIVNKTITKATIQTEENKELNNNLEVKESVASTKKNKKIISLSLFIGILIILLMIIYKFFILAPIPSIKDVYLKDDKIVIVNIKTAKYNLRNKVYCMYSTSENLPNKDDKNWKVINDGKCSYQLDKNIYYLYLKNENNKIIKVDETTKIGTIKNLKIKNKINYIALDESIKLNVSYDKYGYVEDDIKWSSSNDNIVSVNNSIAKGLSKGEATISASINNKNVTTQVIVTDLIVNRSNYTNKKDLECNIYSQKEANMLDTILQSRINNVGYKTRAGVVEAARFLTLDFKYKINYFYENGRLTGNGVDGEGRYYHKGLYLNENKYSDISKSRKGAKIWGCPLYSVPDGKKDNNGLDCSGFVSWALLNGGFDPGDIGAGITNVKDLTDLGEKRNITTKISNSNEIKAGDLLHNNWSGGHIAIIVGIDKDYYYVAQAIWFDEVGVVISKYSKDELKNKFNEVILMDSYYKKDGEYTQMW